MATELIDKFIGGAITGLLMLAIAGIIYLIKYIFKKIADFTHPSEDKLTKNQFVPERHTNELITEIHKGEKSNSASVSNNTQCKEQVNNMSDLKKYTSKDLNLGVKSILIIAIVLGVIYSIKNLIQHMPAMGYLYPSVEFIGGISTIIANILILSVNILGFYLFVAVRIIILIAIYFVDIQSGMQTLWIDLITISFLFMILQLKRKGVSAWKMMLWNKKLRKSPNYIDKPFVADSIMTNNEVAKPIKKKVKLQFSFNVFVYIAMAIFILIQVLSICMDAAFLKQYWWTAELIRCRTIFASINIGIMLFVLFRQKGWAYVCLSIISLTMIFLTDFIDPLAVKYNVAERDLTINIALFLSAYIPLFITLFFKKHDILGWQILFPKFFAHIENKKLVRTLEVHGDKEGLDRYTKLYRAISPANFLDPYSPEKVKLANELLEALIQNKDNEVVISLIEEKAKTKLGVTI